MHACVVLAQRGTAPRPTTEALVAHAVRRLGVAGEVLAGLHRSPRGQPRLAAPWHASVSHAPGTSACVLADRPVGIDVEAVGRDRADGFPSYLDAREIAFCGDDAERFGAVWTRKEAVAKAAGDLGLAAMRGLHVLDETVACAGLRFRVVRLDVGPGLVGHVALALRDGEDAAASCKLDVHTVSFEP